jgi:hypothetical protein
MTALAPALKVELLIYVNWHWLVTRLKGKLATADEK